MHTVWLQALGVVLGSAASLYQMDDRMLEDICYAYAAAARPNRPPPLPFAAPARQAGTSGSRLAALHTEEAPLRHGACFDRLAALPSGQAVAGRLPPPPPSR